MLKYYFSLLLPIFLYAACKNPEDNPDIEFIKAIAFRDAEVVTAFNKGISVETFANYQPKNDSLFYMSREVSDTSGIETFTTNISATPYKNQFLNTVKALQKYKEGNIIDDSLLDCSQAVYVEFKMKGKIYYHYFRYADDTLNQFRSLFSSLFLKPLKKQKVSTNTINYELEAINAMKNVGEYEKMQEPYISVTCTDELDKSKIHGSWRSVGDGFNSKEDFMKLTITQTNSCFFELIRKGKVKKSYSPAKFKLISTGKELVIKINDASRKILSVTDSCLTIEWNNHIEKYNRL